jgi:hypothetical protein
MRHPLWIAPLYKRHMAPNVVLISVSIVDRISSVNLGRTSNTSASSASNFLGLLFRLLDLGTFAVLVQLSVGTLSGLFSGVVSTALLAVTSLFLGGLGVS